MSRTGSQLLTDFSLFLADEWSSTATGNGNAGATTLVDTKLRRFGDRRLIGWYVRITQADTNQYDVRRISDFSASTGTVTVAPAFDEATASGDTYELHRFDPREKFRALDAARYTVASDVFKLYYDESICTDGRNTTEFTIPSALPRPPIQVYVEQVDSPGTGDNFLTTPYQDATTGWTASAGTLSTVTAGQTDLVIPKYNSTCLKWVIAASTAATLKQAVAAMTNSITAADAGGRKMSAWMWVYCLTASKVTLVLEDDAGTTTDAHDGLGWQRLEVTRSIDSDNATKLDLYLSVDNDSSPVVVYANGGKLAYGDQLPIRWSREPLPDVRWDDTTKRFFLRDPIMGKRQLRLVGKGPLSALGDVAATQVSATMEVDEQTQRLLFAAAAVQLFRNAGLNMADFAEVQKNIALVEQDRATLRMLWQQPTPNNRIVSPYA